jgi:hypothetical protein
LTNIQAYPNGISEQRIKDDFREFIEDKEVIIFIEYVIDKIENLVNN